MPSWNIHTAHVEHLLGGRDPLELGIADTDAFLFGNYVPDIYVGFLVPDITYRLDYCLTHLARVNVIPLPDPDRFWDDFIYRRRSETPAGLSLALGVWAHLVADRFYNMRFRAFCQTHDVPEGETLRKAKQDDFDLFGHSLGISSHVQVTPELLEAAQNFKGYSILPGDVERAVAVADETVRVAAVEPDVMSYQLLSAEWMEETFGMCDGYLASWLESWQRLEAERGPVSVDDIDSERS